MALAILAVLAGMALVYMPEFVAAKRSDAALRSLRVMINFARHAAIGAWSYRHRVSAAATGRRYRLRTAQFLAPRRSGICRLRRQSQVLTATTRNSAAQSRWLQVGCTGARFALAAIWYSPRAVLQTGRTAIFCICPHEGQPGLARQLVLNVTGRTYPSRDSNGDGVHEDVRGRPLRCPIS